MYKALYRKYRPENFNQISGQDHIISVLKNQIKSDKISHAYLFAGVRGTGKTSTAKVFAKAVNCQNYDDDKGPCGVCPSCQNGQMDIKEIDAASNNSVDNIRQIKDEIMYMPSFGKYTVYIIDEVHMLSMGAFNALLKTLEEPPEHVIFILATTEIAKVPDTIKSRCQRFEFRAIDEDVIENRLKDILEKEQIPYEDDALLEIVNAASGGLRDGISAIDQLASFGKITKDTVQEVLGSAKTDDSLKIIEAIGKKDVTLALSQIEKMRDEGADISKLPVSIIENLRQLLKIKSSKKELKTEDEFQKILELFTIDSISSLIIGISELDSKMRYSPYPEILLDAFIVEKCSNIEEKKYEHTGSQADNTIVSNLEKRISELEEIIRDIEKSEKSTQQQEIKKCNVKLPKIEEIKKPDNEILEKNIQKPQEIEIENQEITEIQYEEIETTEDLKQLQEKVYTRLREQKQASIAAFFVEGEFYKVAENEYHLLYSKDFSFHMEQMTRIQNSSHVKKALEEVLGIKEIEFKVKGKPEEDPKKKLDRQISHIAESLGVDKNIIEVKE